MCVCARKKRNHEHHHSLAATKNGRERRHGQLLRLPPPTLTPHRRQTGAPCLPRRRERLVPARVRPHSALLAGLAHVVGGFRRARVREEIRRVVWIRAQRRTCRRWDVRRKGTGSRFGSLWNGWRCGKTSALLRLCDCACILVRAGEMDGIRYARSPVDTLLDFLSFRSSTRLGQGGLMVDISVDERRVRPASGDVFDLTGVGFFITEHA